MRPWIHDQITAILGFEDDICSELVISLLQDNVLCHGRPVSNHHDLYRRILGKFISN